MTCEDNEKKNPTLKLKPLFRDSRSSGMGNSNSSRRITVANQTGAGPYKVAEEIWSVDSEHPVGRSANPISNGKREMGNANSSRKITVPNDDPTGVIKVSEAVAKRIKGSTGDTQNVRGGPESRQEMVPAPAYQQHVTTAGSLTALQMQHCKEEELRKNDEYWMQRLHRQQDAHKAMDRHMMQEYDKAVCDVKGSLFQVPDPNDEVPCRCEKDTVAQCYRQNPGQPLKCIQEVLAFQACVDVKRMDKIDNRA